MKGIKIGLLQIVYNHLFLKGIIRLFAKQIKYFSIIIIIAMKFVELLTTNMAIQLGENLNQITKKSCW